MGLMISYYASVKLILILFILLASVYLILTRKIEKYLVYGILTSLFFFSIIFGINTFVYLTIDRIGIALLIILYFLSRKNHIKISSFENLYFIFTLSIIISSLIVTILSGQGMILNTAKKLTIMFVEYFLFFFVLKRVIVKYNIRNILKYTLFLGSIVGVYGILEYLTQKNVLFDFILTNNLPYNPSYEETLLWGQIRGGVMRAKSTFSHALEFGGIQSLLLPFAMYFLFDTKKIKTKLFLLMVIGIFFVSGVVAISRSLMVVNLLTVFLFIILSRSVSPVKKLFLLIGGIVGSIILFILMFNLFFPDGVRNDLSFTQRAGNLQSGATLINKNPFFGLGYGNIPSGQVFDNYYYSLVVQSGFTGLILFILAFTYLLFNYIIKTIKEKNIQMSNFYLTMSLFVLVFLFLNLAYDASGFITVGKVFFFLLALGMAIESKLQQNSLN